MGFWIFMTVKDVLNPLTMIGFGKYFIKRAPKEINDFFGYRTSRSMKNKDTWEFAHHHCGKLWSTLGGIMFFPSVIAMLFVIGKDTNVIGTMGGLISGIQLLFLIGSIFPTERALKNNFDEYGRRKII